MSIHTQTQHPPTAAKKGHCYTKNFFKEGGDESVQDRKRATGLRMEDNEYLLDDDKQSECLLNDDKEALMQQSEKKCAENARAAKNEKGFKFCRKSFATVAEVKESQNPDSFVADKYELLKDNNENNIEASSSCAVNQASRVLCQTSCVLCLVRPLLVNVFSDSVRARTNTAVYVFVPPHVYGGGFLHPFYDYV